MRAGPSLAALAGPVAVGVRVDVYHGGACIASDIPAWDVKVESTLKRVVPSKLTMRVDPGMVPTAPGDPLNNYGQRLHVTALVETGGETVRIPYGWFVLTDWEERAGGMEVTAMDLVQTIVDDQAVWPSSPPAGATLGSEVQRIITSSVAFGQTIPVVLEVPDRAVSTSFQWGVKKAENLQELCDTYGLMYGVKPDGCLHVWALNYGGDPVEVYTGTDLLVGAVRAARERTPNRWIVQGSAQGDSSTKWTAVRENFTGIYAPDRYGIVTERKEFNAATSADAVEKAATSYMRKALAASGARSVQIAADPRLEVGDLILVVVDHEDGTVERIRGRVQALSITLDDPGHVMRVDMMEESWI